MKIFLVGSPTFVLSIAIATLSDAVTVLLKSRPSYL